MASTDEYRGTIAIHIHSDATNINAAGIVYGGLGHRTENGIIIRKEVAPRVGSLQGTEYKTTGGAGSAQGIESETSSQVRSAQCIESETSSQVRSTQNIESETNSQVRSAQNIESETSSQVRSAQSIESESSSQVRSAQNITKETSSEAGCAYDAVQTSWVESELKIETETAKLGTVEGSGQEPPAGEETGCGHDILHANAGGTGVVLSASTGGCRKETNGSVGYQQDLRTPSPAKEESERCQTARKPRQLSRAMKNLDKGLKDNDFHKACKQRDLDRVVRILSEDLDNLNRKDSDGRTGLMVAANQGHRDVVELLVTKGADLTSVDKGGDTVLHAACRAGDINIVKCVLSKDELDVNSSDKSGMTPAMSAARWGYEDVVKLLIRRGAKMQLVDDEGDTILHYACRGGHEDVVECIVSSDAALVNAKNKKGKTAAKVAKEEGHRVVYERLKSVDSGCYLM